MKRKYGWKPDIGDHRDYKFGMTHFAAISFPPVVDNSKFRSKIEDQGDEGSCTGHGWTSAYEAYLLSLGKPSPQLSRQGMYYNIRSLEGTTNYDAGGFIRDGAKALSNIGIWLESLQPYKAGDFKKKPSAAAYKDGLTRKGGSYYRITTLDEMKYALVMKLPIVFGFSVYESFESPQVAKTGIVNLPTSGEKLLGGHCVYMDGYNDTTRRVTCVNSWGPNWGNKGAFTLPYEYVTNTDLADDFWVLKL